MEDLHARDPEWFHEHARSFEFWFDAVQGYLGGLTHGHRPDTPEAPLGDTERDHLLTALANYCIGETAALEGAGGLIRSAPNRAAKVFLATQAADEARHLEVLLHRMSELGAEDPEAEVAQRGLRSLARFRQRLLELVETGTWEEALFAQNVILEAMEFTVFQQHARRADPRTREVLMGVVKDERRHIGFGEAEIGRRLHREPGVRSRLEAVRAELDALVIAAFEETATHVGASPGDRDQLGRGYLQSVARLGFA